ncbi:MAG: M20/M25/M40 family metallo-hydrolase [Candidatus Lokiarchaeota archaeon]|nr:M20/M25/M40 family metallo-hydrolase [Candidatus Lokiarchaeota archaeon]
MNEESFSGGENHLKELIRNTNERFIKEDLTNFLKISSYTSNKEGIIEAKSFLTNYISNLCEEVIEIKGDMNPLLLAKVDGEIKEKLLIYGMYDTQPVSKEKDWLKKPFGAEIAEFPKPLDKLGKVIIARGAYNSKTPLLCFLNVVKLLKEQEKLPMSLLILIDGEEEQGSPTLLNTLKTKKNTFNECFDAYYPSLKQDLNGTSVLKLGYKGILSLNIKASSSNDESHSSFSSMIPNPAQDLIFVLNEIYSDRKFKIKSLSAPYNMTKRENEIMDKLMESIDLEIIKEKAGIKQTLFDDPKQNFIDYLFNPTFNISTLKSGYLENGVKNIVANKAECNIDIRFAHNVSTNLLLDEIKERIRELKRNLKSKFEITHNMGYDRSKVKEDTILVKSLIDSFKKLGVPTQVWPISAAAAPLSQIQSQMGFNFIVGGLGVGGYAHSPNEFVQLKSIQNSRLSNYLFLNNYRYNLVRMKNSADSS